MGSARSAPGPETPPDRGISIVMLALLAVTTALVFISTFSFQIPIPATQGYFNLGDIMIFISALTFGPAVGGFSGGVGSALSDVLGGFSIFAPFTLIIKGLEGFIAGLVSHRKLQGRDLLAWAFGSLIMVGGYFLAESFFIALVFGASNFTGIVAALGEVPFNILQVAGGGLVGIPVSLGLRRALRSTLLSSKLSEKQ